MLSVHGELLLPEPSDVDGGGRQMASVPARCGGPQLRVLGDGVHSWKGGRQEGKSGRPLPSHALHREGTAWHVDFMAAPVSSLDQWTHVSPTGQFPFRPCLLLLHLLCCLVLC